MKWIIKKVCEWVKYDPAKWKWRYLITCPLIFLIIGALFILAYSALIILLMST